MWIITHIHSGKKLYLISEVKKYVVGRVGSDIVLSDDTSISRTHAVFHITNTCLKLEDMGSKYGSFYNEQIETKTKLQKGKLIELREGDRILFGALRNEWLISKNNINTLVSSLNGPQISEVKNLLDSLGGNILTKWEPKCTHLTMSEITITVKVLHALLEKIPIVSCEYWKDYLKGLKETKQPPKASLYLPKRSAFLSSAINLESFNFNDKRKTLFVGKTFVFMSKKHCDMYSPIVMKAGGKCKDLKCNVQKSYLLQKDVIVVQYVASTQSQGSQTINDISEYLESSSLRTIPEYEIGLAIVCCTTEKYCNPSYSTVSHVLSNLTESSPNIGTILAENTHPQKSQINTLELCTVEVPDSDCIHKEDVGSKPIQSEIYEKNSSESDVITIENSENPDEGDCVLQIHESAPTKKNKRKWTFSDESEKSMQTAKKVNTSSLDTFSGNLVMSSDIILDDNKIQLSAEPPNSKVARKSRTPVINDNLQCIGNEKTCVSPSVDANVCIVPNESIVTELPSASAASINHHAKPIPSKSMTENVKKVCKPTSQIQKKSSCKSKNKYSGFLETSQIHPIYREVPAQVTNIDDQQQSKSAPIKRGRIARITDNDSDNEDDIFNFGSSPKKLRSSNSDDELFAFGSKPSHDTVDRSVRNSEEVLPQTQAFIPINRLDTTKATRPKVKISPMKSTSEGWLTKLNMLQIKSDKVKKELEEEDDIENTKRNEWIDSIKGGFEVRVRKMDLFSKGSNCSTVLSSSNSTSNTSKRNFKAFVKKHNYKPQSYIVRTVPMVVQPLR